MGIKKISAFAAAVALSMTVLGGCSNDKKDAAAVKYDWSNVAIGGGGYITGIVYNPTLEGLAYVRTDIGGAYRFDTDKDKWVPITDCFGGDEWNLIGIESIATDPVEPKRVYAACGTYMGENGALIASDDYGETWTRFDLPFGCGGNNSGRGVGERLRVDPVDNSNIYFGSRNSGLWKSEDYGKTWAQVESFPVKGDYSQEGNSIGIMWVQFDPSTNDVYAGAAMTNGECIYKSCDGGETWETLPANIAGYYPLQAEISPDGKMYMACSDTAGPNVDPKNGAVYELDLETQEFTDITPSLDDGRYGGFGGITLDAQDDDTIVVTSLSFWDDKGHNIYRSTDGGESWDALYTKTEKNYQMDVSEADWLTWGRGEASIGWWTAAVALDPFNSDKVSYGTGATLYSTENLTDLGSETPVTIKFDAKGIEETAVYNMVAPPYDENSPQMYSIMGDLTGFSHLDVEKSPDDAHLFKNGDAQSVDCAWLDGNCAVYTSDSKKAALNYTTDGGAVWNTITRLPEKSEGGSVAMSADGKTIIWKPASISGKPYVTPDYGENWYYCEGISYGAKVIADRVNPKTFYATCEGTFYISTDGGYHFEPTGAILTDNSVLTAVGDKEGHVWAATGGSIMYTEDGGKNFTVLKTINAKALGFGAPEKEGGYMTIYVMGNDNVSGNDTPHGDGIYRSTDKGKTWVRLNDDNHLFGNLTYSITGDSEVFGRVYFATNGRGIVMGDVAK